MFFHELQAQVFRAYAEGRHLDALNLASSAMVQFPQELPTLYYWRISLHSALGEQAEALRLCDEVVARELWLNVEYFSADPDLTKLEGQFAFDRLAQWSQERLKEAQASSTPFCLTVAPADENRPCPMLMTFHGNGEHPGLEVHHWQLLTERGYLLVAPQSTQVSGPRNYVWNDHVRAVADAKQYYQTTIASHPVDTERVILGGFSLGAGMAVRLGLSGAIRTQGFIAVAPALLDAEHLEQDLAATPVEGLRGYLVIGDEDKPALDVGERIRQIMTERGLACEVEVHPGLAHAYPADFDKTLARALTFILGA